MAKKDNRFYPSRNGPHPDLPPPGEGHQPHSKGLGSVSFHSSISLSLQTFSINEQFQNTMTPALPAPYSVGSLMNHYTVKKASGIQRLQYLTTISH